MRIMIVGQKWLAAEVLNLCVSLGHEVVIAAAPNIEDRLLKTAIEQNIPVIVIDRRLDLQHIPDEIDLIIAAHAHCYIAAEAREKARLGAIGYHPSLLPLHRGRDAIAWAIRMHEPVTGGSVYWMNDHTDGGPIIAQDWCFIRSDDTAAMLWRRELAPMSLRLFHQALKQIGTGDIQMRTQDEALATWEPALEREKLGG